MSATDLLNAMAEEAATDTIQAANEYASHIADLIGVPSSPELFKTFLILAFNMGASHQVLTDARILAATKGVSVLNRQAG